MLASIGVVYVGYQLASRKIKKSALETPAPTSISGQPTSASSAEEQIEKQTKGWKVYTNTKYGYSIKYPSGVNKKYESPHEVVFQFSGPNQLEDTELYDGFEVNIKVLDNKSETPKELAESYYETAKKNVDIMGGDISKCKIEDIQRNGVTGVRFTHCLKAPGSGVSNFTEWFNCGSSIVQINSVLSKEKYRSIFDLMLQTFKFTGLNEAGNEDVEEESESGEAGSESAEWVKESRGWIRGGLRSSQISVKPSKQVLKPNEQFAVAVDISDFFNQVDSREQEKVYQAYFRLHRISKPNETLREKQVQVKKPKGEIYGGIQPFIWTIKAPQKLGKYTYRVIRGRKEKGRLSWPTFEPASKEFELSERCGNYDLCVQFTITVAQAGGN